MATYSSKQVKRQALVDAIPVIVSILLIGAWAAFGPLNSNMAGPADRLLGTQAGAAERIASSIGVSFASDVHYWNANCGHGWRSDSACSMLASMAQSCEFSMGVRSGYCSEYDIYLQQIRGR